MSRCEFDLLDRRFHELGAGQCENDQTPGYALTDELRPRPPDDDRSFRRTHAGCFGNLLEEGQAHRFRRLAMRGQQPPDKQWYWKQEQQPWEGQADT